MHDLLKQLSAEHIELEQTLAGIRPKQFRTEEGRSRLHRLRDLLHQHIQRERQNLYPVLEQAGRTDERLAGQVSRSSEDLEIVSSLADEFVRKYESGQPQLIEFATDHGALLTILRIRLRQEEETLFPLFERVSRS